MDNYEELGISDKALSIVREAEEAVRAEFEKIDDMQKEIEQKLSLQPKVLINILHFVYDTITEDNETEIYVNNAKSIHIFLFFII